jgi:hypothetical protein
MGFFDKLFGSGPNDDDDHPQAMPWDEHPSIYEHVQSHIDPAKCGLTEGGETLPDEQKLTAQSQIRWAAGAMDGVATHHMGAADTDEQVKSTVSLVLAYCDQPTAKNKYAIYQHVIDHSIVSIIDSVLEGLVSQESINHDRLYELARSFVTEATDREPVKFGLAVLGLYEHPDHVELFQTIGRHDEFTLYCAVALTNSTEDPEMALWELAKSVDGWGRIHVVERLAETERPEIKQWLLREGYRNSIMYEYLAYTCATAGGLMTALSEEGIDRELLTSAGEIIQALINGGPAENMDSYDDGAFVVEMLVGHLEHSAETLADFLVLNSIRRFLQDDEADWESRAERGWTDKRRTALEATCTEIIRRPDWVEKVHNALNSQDELVFHEGDQSAKFLDIDTWDHHWRRLQEKPSDSGRWYHLMAIVDEARLPQVLAFAEKSIDLAQIATGPGDEMGLGPDFEPHTCLDYVLQELRRFPDYGAVFLEAGLKSPVVRNRNMALAALSEWEQSDRPSSALAVLKAAAAIEPVDDVRERMTRVLQGKPLDD